MTQHLKVIELAGILAGPAVGMFFAELGAQVIKIENPLTGGDAARTWKLPEENISDNTSAYFNAVNWNKTHLFLNLENADDRAVLLSHIADADIVICNWKKGDAEKLQVRYDDVKAKNPKIIYAQVLGFDAQSDRVAFDIVLQAETGWISMNGTQQGELCKIPVAIIDLFAAHQLKEGILVALLNRLSTGAGACVTVSLFDAAIASLANQASNWLNVGHLPAPMGTLHPNIAPYGEVVTTQDGVQWILAVGTDKQFNQLCNILHQEELLADDAYKNNALRVQYRTQLHALLQNKIQYISSQEFSLACIQHNIPVGRIRNMQEVFDLPQAASLILEDKAGKRVKSTVFQITA